MPHAINPYIAGNPVTGTEMFFGREDVFAFIRQTLIGQHRDNVVVLYGQRRTGKTSVLYQMSRHLDRRYLCIFIDLHSLALDGLGGFLWELANHIRRVLHRDYQADLPPLHRAEFMGNPRSNFENEFLPQAWSAIGDRHLLLMLDEAIRLQEQVAAGKLEREIFQYLRHLMQHDWRLNFLFSLGSGLEEMEEQYAFLFNVALYKKISFLRPDAAVDLITLPVREQYQVEAAAIKHIIALTSAHPYYVQLLCHGVFNRWQQRGSASIRIEDVDAVLDEAVERGSAVLKHVYEESTTDEKMLMAGIAAAMVARNRPVRTSDVRRVWARLGVAVPDRSLTTATKSLVARDVIAGSERYAFTVDLQRLWMKKHKRIEWVKDELDETVHIWADQHADRQFANVPQWAKIGMPAVIVLLAFALTLHTIFPWSPNANVSPSVSVPAAHAPSIKTVLIPSGPVTGGANVTIIGENFRDGAMVSFDGVRSPCVAFQSSTAITATIPKSPAGSLQVVVTTDSGQSEPYRFVPPLVGARSAGNAPKPVASNPDVYEFETKTSGASPRGIIVGPDRNLWFAEFAASRIGKITEKGDVEEYNVSPCASDTGDGSVATSSPTAIARGPDNALWFTEKQPNKIGRVTQEGEFQEFAISTAASAPSGITVGPDGNLWFTELAANKIGVIGTDGKMVAEHPIRTSESGPTAITMGPDDNLWFTEANASQIGRITPDGQILEYPISTRQVSGASGITRGPDGNLWFTEFDSNQIGVMGTDGTMRVEYPIVHTQKSETAESGPTAITLGPDGNVWFVETKVNRIARITPRGQIEEVLVPTREGMPAGIVAGPDGNIWFTEDREDQVGKIGRVQLDTMNRSPSALSPTAPNGMGAA